LGDSPWGLKAIGVADGRRCRHVNCVEGDGDIGRDVIDRVVAARTWEGGKAVRHRDDRTSRKRESERRGREKRMETARGNERSIWRSYVCFASACRSLNWDKFETLEEAIA
jgi:hypothetical protein